MLATINCPNYRILQDYVGSVKIDCYVVPLPAYVAGNNTDIRNQYIQAFLANYEDYHYDYAQLLLNEVSYQLLYPKNPRDRRHVESIGFPIPASMLTVLDEHDNGTRMQLTDFPGLQMPLYQTLDALGTLVQVAKANREYEGDGYMLLDGPYIGTYILATKLSPAVAGYVNPWTPKVVMQSDSSSSAFPSTMNGRYLRILEHSNGTHVSKASGNKMGKLVAKCHVTFTYPKDEREAEIFDRKVVDPFRLELGEKAAGMLSTMSGSAASTLNTWADANYNALEEGNLGAAPGNYIEVDPADYTRATYIPQSKVAGVLEKGQDPWTCAARQSTTWSKVFGMMLSLTIFGSSDAESFGTKMVALASELYGPEDKKPELTVIYGDEVGKYYHSSYYDALQGSLGSSCMRNAPAVWFDVYSKNPKQVGLLICRNRANQKIMGRALLWTDAEGNKFIDRRYSTTPVVETRMLNYATKELGAVNIYGGTPGSTASTHCSVILEKPFHKHYPYIDSVRHFNPLTGELTNKPKKGLEFVSVSSTSGGRATASYEARCAHSNIIAPRTLMDETASGGYAFSEYVKTLRSGKKELESRCKTDELEGGLISQSEAVPVYTDAACEKTVVSTAGSPLVAYITKGDKKGVIVKKDLLVFSRIDGGYIFKKNAIAQPDGTYCLPESAAAYQAFLAKRKVNKALLAPAVAAEPANILQYA